MRKTVLILLALVGIGGGVAVWSQMGNAQMRVETIVIVTASGRHTFSVEIADTGDLRRTGLMFRKEMAPDHGMLFDNGKDKKMNMWMKNTFLPLDMIFIAHEGTIVEIARNAVPHSEKIISTSVPVRGVLEVLAGTADRIGVKPGDRLEHPLFQ